MTTTMMRRAGALAALLWTLAPTPARADFLVEPFFIFAQNKDTSRWLPGGGVAIEFAKGWLLAGGELGHVPGFFDPKENVRDLIASSHVLTLSGTAGVTLPASQDADRYFPYFTIGFGIMRQDARDRDGFIDVTRNDPSINYGGGIRVLLAEFVGVRADIRQYRSLRDPFENPDPIVADFDRVHFWRFAVGAVIRFGSQ